MKKILKNLFILFRVDSILRYKNRRSRILFWHGVDNNPHSLIEAESIHIDKFKLQIEYLNKYYEIISIEDFYERCKRKSLNGKEIVLTFDDGYRNNLTVLAPYLNSLKLPFTVFISTNHIESGDIYPTSLLRLMIFGSNLSRINIPFLKKEFLLEKEIDKINMYKYLSDYIKTHPLNDVKIIYNELLENVGRDNYKKLVQTYNSLLPMNWNEVKLLSEMGATIGSHCLDHICCHDNQNSDELVRQITQSKRVIEEKLGVSCDFFAYPNGDYNDIAINSVLNAGYKMGFTTKNIAIQQNVEQFPIIPRVSVPFNVDTFKIIVNK